MRKIVIAIVVVLMLIGTVYAVIRGVEKVNLYGVTDVKEKNNEVDSKNAELSNVINVTYTNTESSLKQSARKLTDTKTEYENQAILVAESAGSSYALKTEKYEIDYLWTKLGNYAKDEGVAIKIDVKANAADSRYYDLIFTVAGTYVGITDFIYDIENDSKLGYKIEDFSMSATNGNVYAAFACKDIAIDVGKIDTGTSTENNSDTSSDDNNSNTTKTNTTTKSKTNTTSNTTSGSSRNTTNSNTVTTTNSNTAQDTPDENSQAQN